MYRVPHFSSQANKLQTRSGVYKFPSPDASSDRHARRMREDRKDNFATGKTKITIVQFVRFFLSPPTSDVSFVEMNNIMLPECQEDDTKPQAEKN